MTTLATRIRENKALYVAAGAGDLAAEKLRELPEAVTKLRETASKYQERVDTKDIPGAAVSYVTHAGTRVVEFVDALAARGEKVVNKTEAVAAEVEAGTKRTTAQAKTAAGQTKRTAQANAKKAEDTAKS
jgi:hypothetical protein